MIIGVTGNSGSGKTMLSNLLKKEYDAYLIDADETVKSLSIPGGNYYNEIVKKFGNSILLESGKIDKTKLADIIFNDSIKRESLNTITFKYIVEEIKRMVSLSNAKMIIIDAPLLIESNLDKICDVVISVIADDNIKQERICIRDNIDKSKALARINAQPENDYYIKNSNYVIINNEENFLEEQIDSIKEILESDAVKSKEVVIIQNKDLRIIEFKRLLEYKNELVHAFTIKPFDFGSNETYRNIKDKVNDNYNIVCNFLNINNNNIIRPKQTHTNNIQEVKNETGIFNKDFINIDGLITKEKNKVLSLVYADCTPIYLYDKSKKIIGNIHSGWQGTTKKISKEAVRFMKEKLGSNPEDIICIIGPTIRKCHFEVKKDVRDIFYETFKYMDDIDDIIKNNKKNDSFNIDTVRINKKLLEEEGVLQHNIIDSKICSVCNSKIIHSYRKEGINAGRSTSLICLI